MIFMQIYLQQVICHDIVGNVKAVFGKRQSSTSISFGECRFSTVSLKAAYQVLRDMSAQDFAKLDFQRYSESILELFLGYSGCHAKAKVHEFFHSIFFGHFLLFAAECGCVPLFDQFAVLRHLIRVLEAHASQV